MATLSADELTDIRFVTGAEAAAVLSNTVIQTLYDLATTDAPATAQVMNYTYVYILRRLWGYQRTRVDRTTDHGDRQTRIQIADNTKALLDYYEGLAGLGDGAGGVYGSLSVGSLALGIDATEDNESDWDGTED